MGDNGFSNWKKPDPSWFRLFCEDTFLQVFGAGGKTATVSENSTPAGSAGNSALELPASEHCQHQWLRPDSGVIECASCGATRLHYGE